MKFLHFLRGPKLGFMAFCLGFLVIMASSAQAEIPTEPKAREAIVGHPLAISVSPAKAHLVGPWDWQQIIVTGQYENGQVRDLTPFCQFRVANPKQVEVDATGFLRPRGNGQTSLEIQVGKFTQSIPVQVGEMETPRPVSFHREIIAVLNVGGCNSGACHGTPSGKNGFKLSLRGFDPESDFQILTRDIIGRRTSRLGPEHSLIYLKGLGKVPHEGGQRFVEQSIPAGLLADWLTQGMPQDSTTQVGLKKIEIIPGDRILQQPARWQQLAIMAHFAGGKTKDVTRLTVFSSSDNNVAQVNDRGFVEFQQAGEVGILCRYLDEMVTVRLTYLEPKPGFQWSSPPESNYIDKYVFSKLKLLNILPSSVCTDEEFVRRVYLDVCGILPNPDQVRAFLTSPQKDKQAKLIDDLLNQPEYSDFWTLKWSDVLRSSRKTIELKGAMVFQRWLKGHMEKNTPIDQVVGELLTGAGNTFSNPPANFFRISRDPTTLAETTAQLFFGIRMQCAKCHNHPFERWTQDDYYSLAAFFAQVKRRPDHTEAVKSKNPPASEVVFLDRVGEVIQPRTNKTMPPKFLGGDVPPIKQGDDRRQVLAQWVTSPKNPFFSKSIVNRVWYHLLGKGIVDPVDDFRDSNPSANDELLSALAKDFADHKYDLKHLLRTILNSTTYQLSANTNDYNKEVTKYFSHAVTKLYTAEQLLDAICQVTGVPETFAGMPPGTRAVQLPDGEVNHPFLKTFGQPARELACECERENESNLAQALQLINGPTVNERLRNPNNILGKMLGNKKADKDILENLYLTTLSRMPSASEATPSLEYVRQAENKRLAWEDVLWALINSKEFLFRH